MVFGTSDKMEQIEFPRFSRHSTSTLSLSEDGNADRRPTDSSFGTRGCMTMKRRHRYQQLHKLIAVNGRRGHRKSQALPWLQQLVSAPKPFRPVHVRSVLERLTLRQNFPECSMVQ